MRKEGKGPFLPSMKPRPNTNSAARVIMLAILFILVFVSLLSSMFSLSFTSFSTSQVKAPSSYCETPSLPRGSVNVVVGAFQYKQREGNTAFSDNNYLFENIGLTNADIYWYRRVAPEIALQPTVKGPCGVRMMERLLLPNQGRDGAALLDHILEIYDRPPLFLVFIHGHVALGRSTSCEAIFARPTYVYRAWTTTNQDNQTTSTLVRDHIMTLTSSEEGTRNFNHRNFFGKSDNKNNTRLLQQDHVGHRQLRSSETTPCSIFIEKWKETLTPFLPRKPPFESCCASFVLPGSRIHRFPRALYEDLQRVQTFQGYPDSMTSRECFEFIIYQLLGDEDGQFSDHDYQQIYVEADGLVNGRQQSADTAVVHRVAECKRAIHMNRWEKGRYVRHRKWRNSLKKIGIRTKMLQEMETKAERESAWSKAHG